MSKQLERDKRYLGAFFKAANSVNMYNNNYRLWQTAVNDYKFRKNRWVSKNPGQKLPIDDTVRGAPWQRVGKQFNGTQLMGFKLKANFSWPNKNFYEKE